MCGFFGFRGFCVFPIWIPVRIYAWILCFLIFMIFVIFHAFVLSMDFMVFMDFVILYGASYADCHRDFVIL